MGSPYLKSSLLLALGGIDGGVERLGLGSVADAVDVGEEIDVLLGDGGQVGGQSAEDLKGLLGGVTGDTAADGDVVVGLGVEDVLALHDGAGGGEGSEAEGDERELHFDGWGWKLV